MLGRGPGELSALLEDQLLTSVRPGEVFWAETARVLSSVLRGRLHGTQAERLSGKFVAPLGQIQLDLG